MTYVQGQDVAEFLGQGADPTVVALAEQYVLIVIALARSYTRGNGFDPDGIGLSEDVAAVVVCATARLLTNPQQYTREQVGDWSAVGGFTGWTLAELYVLNAYRRRTA